MATSGQQHDGSDTFMLLAVALLLASAVFWFVAGSAVGHGVWTLMRWESAAVAPLMDLFSPKAQHAFQSWQTLLAKPVPEAMSRPGTVWAVLSHGAQWIRWPVIALVVLIIGAGFRRHPGARYSRVMDMEGLLRERMRTHPRMRPIMWLGGKSMRERGNYTPPLDPFTWAVQHDVVDVDATTGNALADSFDSDRAHAAFARQLGRRLTGDDFGEVFAELEFHEGILASAFVCRIIGRVELADTILDDASIGFGPDWPWTTRIARTLRGRALCGWPAHGPWMIRLGSNGLKALRQTRSALNDPDAAARVAPILAEHAHSRTLLAGLLEAAQRNGIITTSDFIWVKAVDRALHYALNDVGRRVASSEASGVRAHMQAEHAAGHALSEPQVGAAVEALQTYLGETDWEAPTSAF